MSVYGDDLIGIGATSLSSGDFLKVPSPIPHGRERVDGSGVIEIVGFPSDDQGVQGRKMPDVDDLHPDRKGG